MSSGVARHTMDNMGGFAAREVAVKTGDVVEGRYRIIKTLGAGGMGTVFLAEHALIKRRVAIKILHQDLATDESIVERFMNEARAAGTLGHPNIVESTDMGFTSEHVPYIVFEYLEGTLLTDEIYRVGGLPMRRAQRCGDLLRDPDRAPYRQPTDAIDLVGQQHALEVLEHDVRDVSLREAHVRRLDDVRMAERAGRSRLVHEALDDMLVGG